MKCESCQTIITQNEADEGDYAWAATHDGEVSGTTWCPACVRAMNEAEAPGGAR